MKKRILAAAVCAAAALVVVFGAAMRVEKESSIQTDNAANFGALLTDLVNACETPAASDGETIESDLRRIRSVSREDYAVARSIADHWRQVYLAPDYRLYLFRGGDRAEELEDSGIPDSPSHAIVVLGYALKDGRMQPELEERCEAAAAAARSFPRAILVCSGGATGENNPEGHTEAGLMKAYLAETCGIEASRIFIDEQAMTTQENAVNTFEILKENDVRTMTIVTSAYHQRRGQAIYNALAALYRQREGYSVEILANYNADVEPSSTLYSVDARVAATQIAGILELPEEVVKALPSVRPAPPAPRG